MFHCELCGIQVILKSCEHMPTSVCGLLMVHIVVLNGLLLRLNSRGKAEKGYHNKFDGFGGYQYFPSGPRPWTACCGHMSSVVLL